MSLTSFFGSMWWLLDLIANYRPHHAVVLIPLGLLALMGDRRLAAVVLAAGLLDLAVVAPYLVGSTPSMAPDAGQLEVMTFNVGISNPNRAEIAAYIASEDPDVVFIFESSFEWEDAFRRADLDVQLVQVVPPNRLSGVSILARTSLHPQMLEPGFPGEVGALEIDLGDGRITMLGIHPPSPTSQERSEIRDRVITDAAEWVAGLDGEVVVVGDLNATPWSHVFRTLRRKAGLVDTMRGHGLQPSWPDGWGVLAIPIDHVLHTSGLGSADRRTGPAFESAHRPVVVTIGPAG